MNHTFPSFSEVKSVYKFVIFPPGFSNTYIDIQSLRTINTGAWNKAHLRQRVKEETAHDHARNLHYTLLRTVSRTILLTIKFTEYLTIRSGMVWLYKPGKGSQMPPRAGQEMQTSAAGPEAEEQAVLPVANSSADASREAGGGGRAGPHAQCCQMFNRSQKFKIVYIISCQFKLP